MPKREATVISYIEAVAIAFIRVSICVADKAKPPEPQMPIAPICSRFTKCERKAPKFIYGDISSLKNNDSISLFFIVLYF